MPRKPSLRVVEHPSSWPTEEQVKEEYDAFLRALAAEDNSVARWVHPQGSMRDFAKDGYQSPRRVFHETLMEVATATFVIAFWAMVAWLFCAWWYTG